MPPLTPKTTPGLIGSPMAVPNGSCLGYMNTANVSNDASQHEDVGGWLFPCGRAQNNLPPAPAPDSGSVGSSRVQGCSEGGSRAVWRPVWGAMRWGCPGLRCSSHLPEKGGEQGKLGRSAGGVGSLRREQKPCPQYMGHQGHPFSCLWKSCGPTIPLEVLPTASGSKDLFALIYSNNYQFQRKSRRVPVIRAPKSLRVNRQPFTSRPRHGNELVGKVPRKTEATVDCSPTEKSTGFPTQH